MCCAWSRLDKLLLLQCRFSQLRRRRGPVLRELLVALLRPVVLLLLLQALVLLRAPRFREVQS